MKDPIESAVRPDHYHRDTPHEVIPVISAWKLNFNRGNVIKYVARAHKKGQELIDLRKAREYLDREIAMLEGEADKVIAAVCHTPTNSEPCDRCEAPSGIHGLGQYLLCDACWAECGASNGRFQIRITHAGQARASRREEMMEKAMEELRSR